MTLDELVHRPPAELDRSEWQYLLSNVTTEHWSQYRAKLLELTQALIRRGFARDAFDLLPPATDELDTRVEQLRAFAMLNTGAPRSAAHLLGRLLDAGNQDSETLSFCGRAEKELARGARTTTASAVHTERSLMYYRAAFEVSGQPYPGINAATLAARCGRIKEARAIATQVETACESLSADYWTWATLGEARLILGHFDAAMEAYGRFASSHRRDYSALASSRRQAMELFDALGLDRARLLYAFPVPQIVMFAGHRADPPDRARARLPMAGSPQLQAALAGALRELAIDIGYAAAANGADILFLESLVELGAELHIVLPFEIDAFKRHSVIDDGNPQWAQRFDAVVAQCASLTIAGEGADVADPESIVYGNLVMLGLARLKSEELAGKLSAMAVWDGETGELGGTSDTLARCQAIGLPITVVSPAGQRLSPGLIPPIAATSKKREIMGLLFADVVGYSQFTEAEIEIYYADLLVRIAQLSAQDRFSPIARETFGDSFYFVTKELTQAAELALALQALFNNHDQLTQFRNPPKLRIALHAGPLLACYDPIAGRTVYTGRHTSKAARVEPVADDNQILATQQFAALLALSAPQTYELAYAGDRVLPKSYGSERLFVLARWPEE